MFDELTTEAMLAVLDAGEVAEETSTLPITTAHFLLTLLGQPTGRAAHVLAAAGVDPADIERELGAELAALTARRRRKAASLYDRDAATALGQAASIARARGDQLIDTHHLLLGCLQSRRQRARRILLRTGVGHTQIRAAETQLDDRLGHAFPPDSIAWVWSFLDETARFMADAREAQRAGRMDDAIDAFEMALATAESGPPDRAAARIDIYPHLIQALLLAGRTDEALVRMGQAERALDDYEHYVWRSSPDLEDAAALRERHRSHFEAGIVELRFQLLLDRGKIGLGQDDFRSALAAGERLIDLAEEIEHETGRAAGQSLVGQALSYLGGDDERASRLLRESMSGADVDSIDMAARAINLAQLDFFMGRHDEAANGAREARRRYGAIGLERSVAVCDLLIAETAAVRGGEVETAALERAAALDPDGQAELRGWAERVIGIAAMSEDHDVALAHAEAALGIAMDNEHRLAAGLALVLIGEIQAGRSELDAATAAYQEALELGETIPARFAATARRALEGLGAGR